jgi:hypothetical protein
VFGWEGLCTLLCIETLMDDVRRDDIAALPPLAGTREADASIAPI